jgi:hypothetical protein
MGTCEYLVFKGPVQSSLLVLKEGNQNQQLVAGCLESNELDCNLMQLVAIGCRVVNEPVTTGSQPELVHNQL